ncbi:MAG: RNA polymerase sigma factor, partial [Limisphaerales bacterium]
MTETRALLASYVRDGSEEAFREVVNRYINLVYSTALRRVGGDSHLAEDVSQTVFLHLARKAHRLPDEVLLGGWLHRDTCHVAATLRRAERRRHHRERQAMEMKAQPDHTAANLARVAPVLDDAIDQLGKEDRLAIMLRFFEQRDLRSVGEALGSSENAAQKRVSRALEELRLRLQRHGVFLSATALGAALSAEAVTAAPAELAASAAGAALAGTAAGSGLGTVAVKTLVMSKLQLCVAGVVVIASVTAPLLIQHHAQRDLLAQDERLRHQRELLAQIAADNQRLAHLLAQNTTRSAVSNEQTRELLRLRGEVGRLRQNARELRTAAGATDVDAASETTLQEKERRYAQRVSELKQWLKERPSEKIPELALMTERDWLDTAPAADFGLDQALSLMR